MRIFLLFFIIVSNILFSQLYKGPSAGSVESGSVISTNKFTTNLPIIIKERPVRNKIPHQMVKDPYELNKSMEMYKSRFITDPSVYNIMNEQTDSSILVKSFEGILQTNSIPPDPYIAVGPSHIIAVVNSSFRIYDKTGKILKNINADTWFSNVVSNVGTFDPKVIYDHFDERWVMVWLDQDDDKKRSNILISVSDDSDPLGEWYNWALPGNMNGNTSVDNWSDYQGVGYDNKAIFITSNQWSFGGSFQYAKIRVLDKQQLFNSQAGQLEWLDLWDIKNQFPNGTDIFGIRPTRIYGEPEAFYFLSRSPYLTGKYFILYKFTGSISSPEITATKINVADYYDSPNADQLDGSKMLIETNGSNLTNEPVYRDGTLYFVITVGSGSQNKYSSLRCFSFDISSNSMVDDVTIGADGYWYFYPAIVVDKSQNIAMTFSRSGETEYAGAYYMTKSASSNIFNGSRILQKGNGNYVVDYGSERNRWGDYNGIWLDPVNEEHIWLMSEFAAKKNMWGTWIGEIRLAPYSIAFCNVSDSLIDFKSHYVNTSSDTSEIIITNYGYPDLVISDISNANSDFKLLSLPSFPFTLKSFEFLKIKILFNPEEIGKSSDFITVLSNYEDKPEQKIALSGVGYSIDKVAGSTLYASAGLASNGEIIKIDTETGNGTSLGTSGFAELIGLTIHPSQQDLYALYNSSDNRTSLVRVNASKGDAYEVFNSPLSLVSSAYDIDGTLYSVTGNGYLYRINEKTGDSIFVGNIGVSISGIAIDPTDGQLWASIGSIFGVKKDKLYKVDKNTGDTTFVGLTGTNKVTNAITFDEFGNLFGVNGTNIQVSTLIKIDKSNGVAAIIGSTGFKGVKGLAFSKTITEVNENQLAEAIPSKFVLNQNYPNPFNPATKIDYAIPVDANIRVSIFNLIGEEIKVLENGFRKAGYHEVLWDATDSKGKKTSSGIYLYRITAVDLSGKEFVDSKKMILLK